MKGLFNALRRLFFGPTLEELIEEGRFDSAAKRTKREIVEVAAHRAAKQHGEDHADHVRADLNSRFGLVW